MGNSSSSPPADPRGLAQVNSGPDAEAEARRLRRANAEVKVFRVGDEALEAEESATYWMRIPIEERAEFVWKLSCEVYGLGVRKP